MDLTLEQVLDPLRQLAERVETVRTGPSTDPLARAGANTLMRSLQLSRLALEQADLRQLESQWVLRYGELMPDPPR